MVQYAADAQRFSEVAASRWGDGDPHDPQDQRTGPPVTTTAPILLGEALPGRTLPVARYVLAQLLLLICLMAAGMLVVQHMGALKLPGCGVTSACAQLAASRLGNVAGWPVSFLGFAWFAAVWLFFAWTGLRQDAPLPFRWGLRLAAAVSLFFLGVMATHRHFCPYCLAIHAANLAFWLLAESLPRRPGRAYFRPLVGSAALFAAASALLGLCQSATVQLAGSRAEREFQDSLQEIVAHAGRQDAELPQTVAPPLTGRWRRGPDPAAIRLVLFADYECPHCRKVEGEIERAVAGRGDVSLVVKHYPLCGECNRQIHSQGPHPSACRAALAVEAAGLCGGNGGWWQMHDWLRTHDVRFSDTQLRAAVADLKLGEADAYFDAMRGREALQRVKDDVETAAALGIDGTPTLFVNGMELAHPEIAGAIPRTMAALGIGKLRPRALADDRPRPAQERLAAIWLAGRVFDLSAHRGRWTLGPAGAPYRIVLSICHQNEYSARFSAAVQQLVARRRDVRVEFWHFPLTKRANPGYARSGERDFAASYEMALTAEAAGRLGGNEVFWKMHRWLLEHAQDFAPKAAEQEAARLGLNPQEFAAEIHRGGNCSAVDQDIAAAGAAGIQGAPSIFLDGRQVPGPEPTPALMERILDQMDQMMVR